MSLADPHGDVVTTVDVPTTGPATGISHWADYDDFGNPNTAPPPVDGADYGWLGAHQRATTPTGLLLMGARLYNPATAQFTSIDPVYGGNTTNYAYPQDPINHADLDGLNNKGYGGGGVGGAGGSARGPRAGPRGGAAGASGHSAGPRTYSGPRSAPIQRLLSQLPRGKNSHVRMASSEKHLRRLFNKLTRDAFAIHKDGYGGRAVRRQDGVEIGYRRYSKSGGATIDIWVNNKNYKIHIKK